MNSEQPTLLQITPVSDTLRQMMFIFFIVIMIIVLVKGIDLRGTISFGNIREQHNLTPHVSSFKKIADTTQQEHQTNNNHNIIVTKNFHEQMAKPTTHHQIKIPTAPEGRGIISNDVGIFNVANTLSRKSAGETHPSQATGYSQQTKKDLLINQLKNIYAMK